MNDPHPHFPSPGQLDTTQLHPDTDSIPWFYGQSDQGQVRENNEDQFSLHPDRNLFIVADGMGGHAAGEVASLMVVETLQQWLTPGVIEGMEASPLESAISGALRGANLAVLQASENHPEWSGMGSTAVVALLQGQTLTIANVGDSRAYLLRSDALHMLSRDHSVAAVLAEQNQISREEVRTHPLRNRLTVCLGIQSRIQPFTSQIPLQLGDRVMLCSDGLWDMLTDQEIAQIMAENAGADAAVQALINAANAAGGQDNITVVILNIDGRVQFPIASHSAAENSSAPSPDDTVVVVG